MEEASETRDKAAAFGTLVHKWKETGVVPDDGSPDAVCLEKKLILSGVKREDWWVPGEGEHEVTFAIELATAKLILWEAPKDSSTGCNAPEPPGGWQGARCPGCTECDTETADDWKKSFDPKQYLTGSIDWLHWGTEKTLPWVDDLKTGRWPVDVKKSKQLLSYLLVPWIKAGMPVVGWKGVVSITQWPRYRLDCLPKRSSRRVTGLDLVAHLEDIRWATENPTEKNPTEEHCRFCPCRAACDVAYKDYN